MSGNIHHGGSLVYPRGPGSLKGWGFQGIKGSGKLVQVLGFEKQIGQHIDWSDLGKTCWPINQRVDSSKPQHPFSIYFGEKLQCQLPNLL